MINRIESELIARERRNQALRESQTQRESQTLRSAQPTRLAHAKPSQKPLAQKPARTAPPQPRVEGSKVAVKR